MTVLAEAGKFTVYPISTGYNWGMGSAEPVQDDAVVLNLRDMNRIRHLDFNSGTAVIEPGVTQQQLADALRDTAFMLNLTRSSGRTSIIGNALERGVGLYRQRTGDIAGLEVVLPDTTITWFGSRPTNDGRLTPYPHGVGPDLVPMFLQANLGIITAATVRLLLAPPRTSLLQVWCTRERLGPAVDALRTYYRERLATVVTKLFLPSGLSDPDADCVAYICLAGAPELIECSRAALTERAAREGIFHAVRTVDHNNADPLATALLRAYSGDPGYNDRSLQDTFGVSINEIDHHSRVGILFYYLVLPFHGGSVEWACQLVQTIQHECRVDCAVTINTLPPDIVDFVISIRFDRDADGVRRAHHALDLLHERAPAAGFFPQRLDIDHMATPAGTSTGQRQIASRLKRLLDPASILAPGRYITNTDVT
jgi:4-cresol dehydrogenase (hydroxylating)